MTVLTAAATDAWRDVLQSVRLRLESERDRISREIREYPTPIPRCDAQFNYLIEQRDSIARELQRIESLATNAADAGRTIKALIDESGLSEALKSELRSLAKAGQTVSAPR